MRQRAICVAQTCPIPGNVAANLAEHILLAAAGCRVRGRGRLVSGAFAHRLPTRVCRRDRDVGRRPTARTPSGRSGVVCNYRRRWCAGSSRSGSSHRRFCAAARRHAPPLHKATPRSVWRERSVRRSPPPPERSIFQPGARDPLVQLGDGSAALAICADTGRASHPQRAAERGAGTYLASMFVIPSEFDWACARLRQYAVQHSMLVALQTSGVRRGGLAAAGRSSIWSPDGVLRAQLPSSGAGIAVVTETWGRLAQRDSNAGVGINCGRPGKLDSVAHASRHDQRNAIDPDAQPTLTPARSCAAAEPRHV